MTNAELAVLSLLSEQPRHGYDIEQQIEARGMRQWTEIGFSSIYAILKKLERAGWVAAATARSVGQGAPRKEYRITTQGLQAQRAAVLEALSQPGNANAPLLLGLANLPLISSEEAVQALGRYRQALEARLEQLLERAEVQQPLPDFVQAMFDYSSAMIATELAWLQAFIGELEAKDAES